MVCVALISSDSLEWERTQLWALTFKLIRKIIGGVDYKVSHQHTSTAQSLINQSLFVQFEVLHQKRLMEMATFEKKSQFKHFYAYLKFFGEMESTFWADKAFKDIILD